MIFNNPSYSIIAICWGILILYWFVSAFFVKKAVGRRERKNIFWEILWRLPIAVIVFIIVELSVAGNTYSNSLKPFEILLTILIPNTFASLSIGSVITVIGLGIAIWARVTLGRNWSSIVTLTKEHELITSGPYEFIRHPIYAGVITMFIGSAIAWGFVCIFVVTLIVFVGLGGRIIQEEKLMIQHFGKKYIAYKKRTNALIPFVW